MNGVASANGETRVTAPLLTQCGSKKELAVSFRLDSRANGGARRVATFRCWCRRGQSLPGERRLSFPSIFRLTNGLGNGKKRCTEADQIAGEDGNREINVAAS